MANENESAVLFVTKWALSKGIVKTRLHPSDEPGRWLDKHFNSYVEGRDVFHSEQAAQACARKMAKTKVASLQKAMSKVQKIVEGTPVKVVDEVAP